MLQEWLQKNLVPCGTKYFKKFGGIVKGATLDTGFLRAVALKLLKIQTKFA